MTRPRRFAAALAAALCLGAPAVALAQSAGDDQYSDPLGGGSTSTSQQSSPTTTGSGDSLGQTPPTTSTSSGSGSAPATTTSSGSAPTTTTTPASASTANGQLPNTGADAWLVALLGAALVLGGLGLRLRTRDGRF